MKKGQLKFDEIFTVDSKNFTEAELKEIETTMWFRRSVLISNDPNTLERIESILKKCHKGGNSQ